MSHYSSILTPPRCIILAASPVRDMFAAARRSTSFPCFEQTDPTLDPIMSATAPNVHPPEPIITPGTPTKPSPPISPSPTQLKRRREELRLITIPIDMKLPHHNLRGKRLDPQPIHVRINSNDCHGI